ncbi:bifunctional YncE family protein/alkaline phosphatase family protein [Bacillus sp. ISL-40]|uniref:bifunctional YncE family protein/alkaline phosphatase family protein n=1 Tax=unclassified Bacillus (in: firmicutes) TaxID=185979 RepID=UPI001BE6973E|nr:MULTISPECIES: bifunctional YncE family protein/alkaline phosphatase family protein [unclassified Bacillus (in: firmicutes)]MBT2700750.1 bifunctional YncE family protein/alkaline phosphatase family protein [Bacillus sp. ISL-40]MBT2743567.1 bifunctional YncE family protein/alkaline phosphatase family protein [Bacillus sp. ISL-77]
MKRKKILAASLATLLLGSTSAYAGYTQFVGPKADGTAVTSHGWPVTPSGNQVTLGDFPMGGVLSPDHRYLIVSNDGQGEQSLQVVDVNTQKVVQTIPYKSPESLYFGVAFSSDGKTVYASAGGNNKIRVYGFENGTLTEQSPIMLKDSSKTNFYPAGISVSRDGKSLFVANNLNHSVSKIDLATNQIVKTTAVGKHPYAAVMSNDGKSLYVSNWGESSISVVDPETLTIKGTIPVGLHPNAIIENAANGMIYVSNSDSDSVSIIDTKQQKEIKTISLSPYKNAPAGSQPNALTLSEDSKTLYVTNGGNNDVAVIDLQKGEVKGLIPTAWYPSGIYLHDDKLMVLNAKGLGAGSNREGQYIGNMMKGTMSFIDVPDDKQLKKYTKQVEKNNEVYKPTGFSGSEKFPIPRFEGQESPIKHVIYVIKENRTYDQVFGDMEKGNGDPSLTIFGKDITPNIHKLADQFVLLDNFYANAEISAQGHNWSTAAQSNDYVEKNWLANYSGRNRGYDFEGGNEAAYPKAGFLWTNASRSGVSFRSYGEFVNYDKNTGKYVAAEASMGNNFDPDYPSYNLKISDLTRLDAWKEEFKQYEANGNLPQLQIVRLPNDHTLGTKPGELTPQAMVAQNDYALGQLVDMVSNSSYWKDTAIFVTEDDAQNGWDSVDAHRTTSLVISPYTQTGRVDSTMYDTTSMLRTMEMILGMKPMTQFDASAVPMVNSFTQKPNFSPFKVEEPTYPLDRKNGETAPMAQESKKLDFSGVDHADSEKLNKILWKATKGDKPYPGEKKNN